MLGLDALVALDLGQRLVEEQFRYDDERLGPPPEETRSRRRLVRSRLRPAPRRFRAIAGIVRGNSG